MILKKILIEELDALTCWEFLFNQPVRFGHTYLNPMRPDKSPGCKFFRHENTILFVDHSRGKTYNIGTAAAILYGCSYHQALERLYLKTGKVIRAKPLPVQTCRIEVVEKEYTDKFLNYWGFLNVKRWQLERKETKVREVKNFSTIWKNSKGESKETYYPNDLVFAYCGQKGHKIYFPERDKPRFKSSLDKEDVWEVINDERKWLITKSHKDLLVLEGMLLDTEFEDYSLSMVQSEGTFPYRKYWEQANRLIILMDNDIAGQEAAQKMKDYYLNGELVFLESAKDISDLVHLIGYEDARLELLNILKNG